MSSTAEQKIAELRKVGDVREFLQRFDQEFDDTSLAQAMTEFFDATCLSKASLARLSGMSEVYIHQIFSGKRIPSREKVICLCLAMETPLPKVQYLLSLAGHASLRWENRYDCIVIYALLHHLTLQELDELLQQEVQRSLF